MVVNKAGTVFDKHKNDKYLQEGGVWLSRRRLHFQMSNWILKPSKSKKAQILQIFEG